jgi:hypothetical protein
MDCVYILCYSWDTYWGLLAALSIVGLASAILKVLVGRPRPNYYALRYGTYTYTYLHCMFHVFAASCNSTYIELFSLLPCHYSQYTLAVLVSLLSSTSHITLILIMIQYNLFKTTTVTMQQ